MNSVYKADNNVMLNISKRNNYFFVTLSENGRKSFTTRSDMAQLKEMLKQHNIENIRYVSGENIFGR